jgi:hypothetical protein
MEVKMACCNTSWEKWLYLLAVIALIIGLFGSNMAMIILAVLLAIVAYLMRKSPVVSKPKAKNTVKPKSKAKQRR